MNLINKSENCLIYARSLLNKNTKHLLSIKLFYLLLNKTILYEKTVLFH